MAWPTLNPFTRRSSNTRSCWGYTFELTEEHLTPELMYPMKHSYDVLGEQALKRLNAIASPNSTVVFEEHQNSQESSKKQTSASEFPEKRIAALAKRDLFILLRDHADNDPLLGKLWKEAQTIPSWVNWKQVERGQEVFYRYGGPCLTGLAYQSLVSSA